MKHLQRLFSVLIVIFVLSVPAAALGLSVGDRAPGFTAESTQGTISLADYAGKKHVVLALYFAVFTPV